MTCCGSTHWISQANHTVEKCPQPSLRITWYLPLNRSPIFTWWYPPDTHTNKQNVNIRCLCIWVCKPASSGGWCVCEEMKVFTPAVVVGVLLLLFVGAQDLLILLWEGRVCLPWLRSPSSTMRLWPGGRQRGRQTQRRDKKSDHWITASW